VCVCVTNNPEHRSPRHCLPQQASRNNPAIYLRWRALDTERVVELHPRVSTSHCWSVSRINIIFCGDVWLQINFFKNPHSTQCQGVTFWFSSFGKPTLVRVLSRVSVCRLCLKEHQCIARSRPGSEIRLCFSGILNLLPVANMYRVVQ
jgi:hypothetical protein